MTSFGRPKEETDPPKINLTNINWINKLRVGSSPPKKEKNTGLKVYGALLRANENHLYFHRAVKYNILWHLVFSVSKRTFEGHHVQRYLLLLWEGPTDTVTEDNSITWYTKKQFSNRSCKIELLLLTVLLLPSLFKREVGR